MKFRTWLIIVLFVLVVLMVHNPKQTTADITSGEQAFVGTAGAGLHGFLAAPSKKG